MSRLSLTYLRKLKANGEKMSCLTAYDASFAYLIDAAGVEIILVGDSLGMVVQGHDSTLPVTMDHMVYHSQLVHRSTQRSVLMVDMPFMSYATPEQALHNAARLMQEGHAQIVKLEGGAWLAETVQLLTERGIPVCTHLGLTPQSVHQLGGYRVQGRSDESAERLRRDALTLQAAGASALLFECVPSTLAAEITRSVDIPVIGIGAGVACDGQVLVLYDMLGISHGKRPSFSKDFLEESVSIPAAIAAFHDAVKQSRFPTAEYSFS